MRRHLLPSEEAPDREIATMTSRRNFHKIVATAAIAAVAAPAVVRAQTAFKWKMQSIWQAGNIQQKIFEDFAASVARASNNRLQIEPLPVGTVVGPNECMDAVAAGVLDAMQGGSTYWTGKDAAFALIGDLPGGFDNPYQMQEWYEYGGGLALTRELYAKHGCHYVGPTWWGVESIPSKKPLRTLEDFKGVKMRVPQGMGQDIFKKLGAAPVNLPGSEVYTALERGVIDAADWSVISANDDLGYHKIAKYPMYPGFHSMPACDNSVNAAKWATLPDDLKAIFEVCVRDHSRDMVQRLAVADAKVISQAKEKGFEPISLSDADRRKFREVSMTVWDEYAKRSPMAKRINESQVAFMKSIALL